jgi:hypothetical protein
MPKIEKPDLKKRGVMSTLFKFLLLIAVIVGIWSRSCWRDNEVNKIVIENIRIVEQTPVSVVVYFDIDNQTYQSGKKQFLIEVFTGRNDKIASSLINVDVDAKEKRGVVKQIEKFDRALLEGETITNVNVSLYQRKGL